MLLNEQSPEFIIHKELAIGICKSDIPPNYSNQFLMHVNVIRTQFLTFQFLSK